MSLNGTGERLLLAAVIVRAALDAVRGKDPGFRDSSFGHYHRNLARQWFGLDQNLPNLTEERGDCFTFAECCEALSLCPESVHKKLKKVDRSGEEIKKLYAGTYTSILRRVVLDHTEEYEAEIPATSYSKRFR